MSTAPPTTGRQPGDRREIFAWCLYDWANSAYSTILITIVVAYLAHILPGEPGTLAYSWGIGLSMLLAAVLSPIVGAMADVNASKGKWLAMTSLPGASCAILMALLPPEQPWAIVVAFFFASLGFELSLGFYNGFLPEITTEETIDRVSAFGFALGYIGGAIPLILAILMAMSDAQLSPWLPDYLIGDINASASGELAVEVPSGKYKVVLVVGDARQGHDEMQFVVEGSELPPFSVSARQYESLTHEVQVADGELTIEMRDQGGSDPLAVINGLSIEDSDGAQPVPPLDFGTPTSPLSPQHVRVSPETHFQSWKLEDLGFTPPEDGESAGRTPQDEVRLGWRSGDIEARDRIVSTRLRAGILLMGLWWGLFAIPALLILRDYGTPPAEPRSTIATARMGLSKVATTLRRVRVYGTLSLFLLAFLIYNDGVQTVISQASNFAIVALDMSAVELGGVILMIQFLAIPGAMTVGWLSTKIGQKTTLLWCLAIWIVILCGALFVTQKWQFWVMGAAVAMVMGGIQSVSRAIMAFMTPKGRTAEFFGFFNLSGKATSFLGPMLYGAIMWATGNQAHWAIVSMLIFFVIGGAIVIRLDFARGRREARQGDNEAA